MELKQLKAQIIIERTKLRRFQHKRKDYLILLKFINSEIAIQERKLKTLAELPAKIEANMVRHVEEIAHKGYSSKDLNTWVGKCPQCHINLTTDDQPYYKNCPYCNGVVPYE